MKALASKRSKPKSYDLYEQRGNDLEERWRGSGANAA
jgi:hypothetical protein